MIGRKLCPVFDLKNFKLLFQLSRLLCSRNRLPQGWKGKINFDLKFYQIFCRVKSDKGKPDVKFCRGIKCLASPHKVISFLALSQY